MNYYITDVQWRSNGGGPPRAALLGGGKIEDIAKSVWLAFLRFHAV